MNFPYYCNTIYLIIIIIHASDSLWSSPIVLVKKQKRYRLPLIE